MTRCDDGDWVASLVRALGRVEEVEGEYCDELAGLRRRQEEEDRENPYRLAGSDPAGVRRSFYEVVCYGGRCGDRRYEPLRDALRDAEHVLGRHPALAAVVKAEERWEEFVVRAFDEDYETSRLAMVGGLLCRARQAGENGLEIASRELQSLLDRSLEEECASASNDLTAGYRVSLFYGLSISGEVEVAENLKIVPVEQTSDILDMEVVANIAPPNDQGNGWEGVGAMVETVPWRPVLFSPGDWPVRVYDTDIDAWDFVALLSVLQGVPMISMADFTERTHRTLPLLLGKPRISGSMGVDHTAWAIASLWRAPELDSGALEKARRLYSKAERGRYREYGPVISRLSEALTRIGQYADDDQILDVAIALEQMYELDQGEISYKLKMRAACFLESNTKARMCVFRKVGQLYDARSAIVHRRKKKSKKESSPEFKEKAFEAGFEVARESVIKLLREGPPRDWNEMVVAGPENEKPQSPEAMVKA